MKDALIQHVEAAVRGLLEDAGDADDPPACALERGQEAGGTACSTEVSEYTRIPIAFLLEFWIPEAPEGGPAPELVIVARPVGVQLEAPAMQLSRHPRAPPTGREETAGLPTGATGDLKALQNR